jgi:diguanylate cyclase (GGDEF)-like protein
MMTLAQPPTSSAGFPPAGPEATTPGPVPAGDALALRHELAMERVRRLVFESVAREELLAHTLQCLVDMVEREAPRLSAAIVFDAGAGTPPDADGGIDRAADPAGQPVAGVAGRLGPALLVAVESALPDLADLPALPTDGALHGRLVPAAGAGGPWAASAAAAGIDPASTWLMPLAVRDREPAGAAGSDSTVAAAPPTSVGMMLILAADPAPPTPAERTLIDLAAELAGFAIGHRRQVARADWQLMHDPLTGLPNATLMLDRLVQAVEGCRRQRTTLAVLLVDLDGLRAVNESAGRAAGDDVLRQLGGRLRDSVRRSDTAARTGGDTFAVVAPVAAGRRDAATLARKVLALLGQPVRVGGRDVSLGAAVGVSLFPDDADAAPRLLHAAEVALHRAKQQGRNAVELFRIADGDTTTLADLEMESQLRKAIESAVRRQAVAAFDPEGLSGTPPAGSPAGTPASGDDPSGLLALHYQPQVDAAGRLLGVEALARWSHPVLGRVPPDRFIAVAEQSGLIVPFGAWALREAVDQARRWYEEFGPAAPRVAVNVSAVQFAEPGFVEAVERLLALARLKPGLLELEITETMLMRDADEAAGKIARLRAAGLSVALDDFGTGYSSLSYLHRLTLDTLKVDRSFVSSVTGGGRTPPAAAPHGGPAGPTPPAGRHAPGGAAVTRAIVSMGRSLGMTVLAEGVETEPQRQLLARFGCERMQGYLFSPPVPAAKVTDMLAAGGTLPLPTTTARSA